MSISQAMTVSALFRKHTLLLQPTITLSKYFTTATTTTATAHDNNKSENINKDNSSSSNNGNTSNSLLLYEGPFAVLSSRLKAVSITSAAVGAVGIPVLIALYSGDIPEAGQYALGGTTMLAACGSTGAVNFCFGPYVHALERVPVRKCKNKKNEEQAANAADNDHAEHQVAGQEYLLKATWRNMFVMKQETVFDPATDVAEYKGIRPFCNFTAKGVPLFVHPEVLLDDEVRKQLLGEKESDKYNMPDKANRKNDEDELF